MAAEQHLSTMSASFRPIGRGRRKSKADVWEEKREIDFQTVVLRAGAAVVDVVEWLSKDVDRLAPQLRHLADTRTQREVEFLAAPIVGIGLITEAGVPAAFEVTHEHGLERGFVDPLTMAPR